MHAEFAGCGDQVAKSGVEFRRSSGEINAFDAVAAAIVEDQVDGFRRHLLTAIGSSVDMAVQAALVAAVSQVHLQGREGFTRDGWEIRLL